MHADILDAVGLDLSMGAGEREQVSRRARDPNFRARVITAYEHKCAVCGFDVMLDNTQIGLEAAHIMWHQAGGPDTENNGLALCVLHHKMFDRGAFTVSCEHRVEVSQHIHGANKLEEYLLVYTGCNIREPQSRDYSPEDEYLEWHHREVFRGPGRV
jgi:putative restriction endonuclease